MIKWDLLTRIEHSPNYRTPQGIGVPEGWCASRIRDAAQSARL